MERHILTQSRLLASIELSPYVSTRSITRYSSGREAVPRSLALACLGWDFLQQQSCPARAAEDTGRYTVTRKP
jgi:hypothetical protein